MIERSLNEKEHEKSMDGSKESQSDHSAFRERVEWSDGRGEKYCIILLESMKYVILS